MIRSRSLILATFIASMAAIASANSGSIPITGFGYDGGATTNGNFNVQGPGLSLTQALPGGASSIGSCTVGTTCTLIWSPASTFGYCLCAIYSGGSVGLQTAQILDGGLTFTASGFYSGGDTLTIPFTVTGTITGYELLNCQNGGLDCELGPQVFSVNISGTGSEVLTLESDVPVGSEAAIFDATAYFSGFAATGTTTTPEPATLVLTATGLMGVWVRWKRG
jgi:hypothetical protein